MQQRNTLINRTTFDSIVSSTRANFESRHLPKFETQLVLDLKLLRKLLQAENMEAAERLAQKCVGICEIMGAVALSGKLRHIERSCGTDDAMSVHILTDELHDILRDTCTQMRTLLHHEPQAPGRSEAGSPKADPA